MRGLISNSNKTPTPHKNSQENFEKAEKILTVGGHTENFCVQDGFLIKKTNKTEGRFYQQIISHNYGLSKYMPQCTQVEFNKVNQEYSSVTIQDLRQDFKKPIIYDIKLGLRTVSSKELSYSGSAITKILRKDVQLHIADKITSSAKYGYRFVGSSNSQDSRFHLGTHPDQMIEEMAAQLSSQDLALIIIELSNMRAYLKSKEGRKFEFIGASVLIVAESDVDINNLSKRAPKVKLIDFAHSNVAGPRGLILDNGVMLTQYRKKLYQKGLTFGLKNLIKDLQTMLDKK